jgi:hypothetical protein
MNILLGDFNAKLGKEDIFKPTVGNESLHKINDGNGVIVADFDTSRNLIVKSTMFPHHIGDNIQMYLLSDRSGHQIVMMTTV